MPASVTLPQPPDAIGARALTYKLRRELARQQAQLNRLVIDEMQEGVLVVDRRGRVRAAHPAGATWASLGERSLKGIGPVELFRVA